VGVDHMEPRESLIDIVKYINARQNQYELILGNITDYLDDIGRPAENGGLKTYAGEMRGAYNDRVTEGTLTSRIITKQLNDLCETLLCRELEPLAAMASLSAGMEYQHGLIDDLWRQHILNHPHDSICCCSLDQVDRDVRARSQYISGTGDYMKKDLLHALAGAVDTSLAGDGAAPLIVFNPLGHQRGGRVKGLVRVPRRFVHERYALYDQTGTYVPSHIALAAVKRKDLESQYMTNGMLASISSKSADGDHMLPSRVADEHTFTVLDVDFIANDVPSMGYKTYFVRPSEYTETAPGVAVAGDGMENEYLKVTFRGGGTFDITDNRGGKTYAGLHYFADREETGDTYQHGEFAETDERTTKDVATVWRLCEQTGFSAAFEAEFAFNLPEKNLEVRRSEKTRPVSMRVRAALYAGLDYLDVRTEIDNTVEDHCLRAVFETGIVTDASRAYDHFNIIKRPVVSGKLPWSRHPFTEFVCVEDPGTARSLCVSTKGLPAYEVISTEAGARLYIELLRAAGRTGGSYPPPEAQCKGSHTFEYAVFVGANRPEEYLEKAANYRYDLLAESGGAHTGPLPPAASFMTLACDGLKPYISCLKRSLNGEIILRLWNPDSDKTVSLTGLVKPRAVWRGMLDEQKKERLDPAAVFLPAKSLTTLIIEL